jgi:hypothetical protein
MTEMTQDFFARLHVLNRHQKLRVIQLLVEDLAIAEERTASSPRNASWPVNYFDETFGSLSDDPLVRPKQGVFEVRE